MRVLIHGIIVIVAFAFQPLHAKPVERGPRNNADTANYTRSALQLDEPRHPGIDLPLYGSNANPDASFTVNIYKEVGGSL